VSFDLLKIVSGFFVSLVRQIIADFFFHTSPLCFRSMGDSSFVAVSYVGELKARVASQANALFNLSGIVFHKQIPTYSLYTKYGLCIEPAGCGPMLMSITGPGCRWSNLFVQWCALEANASIFPVYARCMVR